MTDNTPQVEQLRDMVRELNYLHQITQRISERKEIDVLLHEIMDSCKEVTNSEASSLLIYDPKENNLYFEVAIGDKGSEVKKITCNMGEGIAGWVAENRLPLLIPDCYADPRFNREFDKKSGFRTRSMICVPMLKSDKLIGVIQVINKKNGKEFTERDLNLFQTLAAHCGISIENARLVEVQIRQKALERELETARMIQQNLLPGKLPEFSDADIFFGLKSAKEVGGDYYNVYRINDEYTLLFICDVSGKSISAALIVSTIFATLLTLIKVNESNADVSAISEALNKVLIESTTDEKFATAWFGMYHHKSRKLTSINAGHNSTFIFRNGVLVQELKEGGMFLGLADLPYKTEEVILQPGDEVICFTDGVSEAMNKQGGFYGEERLMKIIGECSGKSSEEIVSNIFNDVAAFADGAEQSDDITCGVFRVL